jgi:hypothetical protein
LGVAVAGLADGATVALCGALTDGGALADAPALALPLGAGGTQPFFTQ